MTGTRYPLLTQNENGRVNPKSESNLPTVWQLITTGFMIELSCSSTSHPRFSTLSVELKRMVFGFVKFIRFQYKI